MLSSLRARFDSRLMTPTLPTWLEGRVRRAVPRPEKAGSVERVRTPSVLKVPLGIICDVSRSLAKIVFGLAYALYFMVRTCVRYLYKHPIHALFNVIILSLLGLAFLTGSELHQQLILSKISDDTIDKVIAGSRFTRNYDSNEIASASSRELLKVGAPEWAQREGVRAVLFYARKAGLSIEDQAVLLAIVDVESGFNPMAHAGTTSACGLFQFVKQTGEQFNLAYSDCMNPWINAKSGVDHFLYNYHRRVEKEVAPLQGAERVFRTFELSYYLHHDGPASTNPSNELKATILSGTQFLFRAYHALQEESESQKKAPSFTESFSANFWKLLDTVITYTHDNPFLGRLALHGGAEGKGAKEG